ncbi:unnamed protein product [Alopecurus aequalis]
MGRKRKSSRMQVHDGVSQGRKGAIHSSPHLPEEIWHHIHSLLPMREAARAASVSHAFQYSWKCHPNLTFTYETVCTKEIVRRWKKDSDDPRYRGKYNKTVDYILKNHGRAGVKTFKLVFYGPYTTKSYGRLNSWLQIAVTPGIGELDLTLGSEKAKFNFPCTHLSGTGGDSLRYLRLENCGLRPTPGICLKSLTRLHLRGVRITGDELRCLLSNSFALEKMSLVYCNDIIRLEIPCQLQRLSSLDVQACSGLQVIENKAPNISTFNFGGHQARLSLGELLKVKKMKVDNSRAIRYAIENLPSSVPNVETLAIYSGSEIGSAPVVSSKFLHLKLLTLHIFGWHFHRDYDYLSLFSFLDASPLLVTFQIIVSRQSEFEKFEGDPSSLRRMPKHFHGNLKRVLIVGFSRQKSMIELACHILENSTSLKWLTLDTCPNNNIRCSENLMRKCFPLGSAIIREAHETVLAVRTHVEGKVPSTVKFNVLGPCSQCHAF